jgi:hypothetical protein
VRIWKYGNSATLVFGKASMKVTYPLRSQGIGTNLWITTPLATILSGRDLAEDYGARVY